MSRGPATWADTQGAFPRSGDAAVTASRPETASQVSE
jgi:hypothetical protein